MSLKESIQLAYQKREELQQALVEVEIARWGKPIALAQIRPNISLAAEYDGLYQFDGTEITELVLGLDPVGYLDGYSAGIQMSWNFFDGGRAQAQARQAEREVERAKIAYTDQQNSILLEVNEAYYTYLSNREKITLTYPNVISATEQLRDARLRFQVGVGTQLDVIDSQRVLTTARQQYLEAIIAYNQAIRALERAVANQPI